MYIVNEYIKLDNSNIHNLSRFHYLTTYSLNESSFLDFTKCKRLDFAYYTLASSSMYLIALDKLMWYRLENTISNNISNIKEFINLN